jgi:hypothetical protein
MNGDVFNAPARRKRLLVRILSLLLAATCIGWTLNQSTALLSQTRQPAGFGLGVIQGALMPLALPNLAVGVDVSIYASNNTGRGYKLGYTAGVNLCGLIFFGLFFWRVNRWRRREALPNGELMTP